MNSRTFLCSFLLLPSAAAAMNGDSGKSEEELFRERYRKETCETLGKRFIGVRCYVRYENGDSFWTQGAIVTSQNLCRGDIEGIYEAPAGKMAQFLDLINKKASRFNCDFLAESCALQARLEQAEQVGQAYKNQQLAKAKAAAALEERYEKFKKAFEARDEMGEKSNKK